MLERWGAGPHVEWFDYIYMARESNDQFLWNKVFIHDQLTGKVAHPQSLYAWASGENVKFGLMGRRFLGVAALCNIDARNLSAEIRILIDPRLVPTHNEIKDAIRSVLDYAFTNGLERVYGYVPCTGSKINRLWEQLAEKVMRRVGHEKHAIRTSKRWMGRTLFEAVKE